jgi:hypothetical protein
MSAFANLPISRKLMAAFAAVVVVIFASSAIVFDRLRVIEWAHDWRVHTIDVLDTLQNAMDAMGSGNRLAWLFDHRRREIFGALSLGWQCLHRGESENKRPHLGQPRPAQPAR